ncbi:hypothetical protein HALLA_21095 (plasmid) [Halostagnicola larsenii XH-48]|uniref:Uncharacterized protein n=1 Tax=Halostagnicola larsenii XH-48 TaxID=797299 RepID=W0JV46_9EURY|nr:hypothetical protein [Halostagnicola larsenii]AHG02404.1 hypothetical protein HALLA_21095 [Halostagnicola larsenii XH-48]
MERTCQSFAVGLVVRVPINAPGSLVDGARSVLERVEPVEVVDEPEVQGIEPGLNDITVDIHTRLELAVGDRGEDTAVVRRRLETGVGVLAVDSIEPTETDPETRVTACEESSGGRSAGEEPLEDRESTATVTENGPLG